MLIYTGNINSKLASGELFAYAEVLQVMRVSLGGSQPESESRKPSSQSENF
jgi:hypothetical protein